MEDAKVRLNALFTKQGRVKRFQTKAEPDNYLHQEIASLEAYQKNRTLVLESTKGDLTSTRDTLSGVTRRISGLQDSAEDGKKRVRDLGDQLSGLKDSQSDLAERRKELWREDSKLDGLVAHAADELKSAEFNLASVDGRGLCLPPFYMFYSNEPRLSQDTGSGLRVVDKIAEQFNLEGVYGPLYRLFEIPDATFSTAVELTAGNRYFVFFCSTTDKPTETFYSLFHVVVDSDQTATKVLDIILKEKTG